MSYITDLPYLIIKNAIVPTLNRIFTHIVDSTLVEGFPTETPHFKSMVVTSNE
jgi:hypothetical protein